MDFMQSSTKSDRIRKSAALLRSQLGVLISLVALLWALEIFDWLTPGSFDLGIVPHTRIGLEHLFYAPFLHFGFEHLVANTFPFFMLGWFVLLRGFGRFFLVILSSTIVGGLGIWLFGMRGSNHEGASILIFGFMGYLLFSSIFERSLQAATLTLITLLLYSSLLWGVLPLVQGVSWEGHLFGFIGGAIASWILSRRSKEQIHIVIDDQLG